MKLVLKGVMVPEATMEKLRNFRTDDVKTRTQVKSNQDTKLPCLPVSTWKTEIYTETDGTNFQNSPPQNKTKHFFNSIYKNTPKPRSFLVLSQFSMHIVNFSNPKSNFCSDALRQFREPILRSFICITNSLERKEKMKRKAQIVGKHHNLQSI